MTSAVLMAALVIYMFPAMGERINLFSAACTFLGVSMTSWGFGRVLAGSEGKSPWAMFILGVALLIVMWYMVF